MKISVVISAYNEEEKIKDCLESVRNLADEIIFVDNSSSDRTVQIAGEYTDKIYTKPNDPVNLNKNKNVGFSKAASPWILSLDADERVTEELAREIKSAVAGEGFDGYEIPRKNIIFGKWIRNSIWWPDYNLRLFKKGNGIFPEKHVHEKIKVEGRIDRLKNPLVHLNYQTVYQFINKLNNSYSESEAQNFINLNRSINWYDVIRWPVNDFLKTFFAQKGYRDGMHGLVLSMLQAMYALVFFAKVWEKKESFKDITPDDFLIKVIREFERAGKEIKFWVFEALIYENPLKKYFYKLKRKIT